MQRRIVSLILTTGLVAMADGVRSQEAIEQAAEQEDGGGLLPVYRLEGVVVQGRALSLVGEANTASQGLVGQEQFELRPFLRSGEVLEVVPGMVVTQHSGTGKANQYFIRGFNLDHGTDFAGFLDGVPLNQPTHGHGQGYLDLNPIIPELVSFVEYKKGPYYAEIGDFAAAGAAEINTFDRLPEGFAKLTVGMDDYYRLVTADSVAFGGGDVLAAVELQHYDGPWDLEEDLRRANAMIKYSGITGGGADVSVAATAYYSEWNATDQIPQRAVDQGLISRLGTIDPTDGGVAERYSIYGDWVQDRSDSTTRALAYAAYSRMNLFSNFTFFLDDPVNGDQFEQVDVRYTIGTNLSHSLDHGGLGDSSKTIVGFQMRHDQIPEVGLFRTRAREQIGRVREDSVAETALGVYVRNETAWTPWLRSVVGLRGDHYAFDVDSDTAVNSGTETDFIASPKGSLIFGPWADTEYYVSAGLGHHSNDARGTTIVIDPASGAPAEPVDALVRSKGAEIGVRTSAIDGLHSTVALWYLELDSELLFVGDAGTTEASRPSRRYGIEFTNYYQPLPWLIFDVDVTLTHSEFTDIDPAGDRIPGAVEHTVAAGVTVDFENGLFGSLRARHFGPRPLIEDDSVRSEATTLLNALAGYRWGPVTIELAVFNLLDSEDHDIDYFYESRLAGEPAAGVADVHFHPVEPRTARLTATYRF